MFLKISKYLRTSLELSLLLDINTSTSTILDINNLERLKPGGWLNDTVYYKA
jgi:hypothetical protein